MSDSRSHRGLFGSPIGQNMALAAGAEVVGTFLLVYAGTAVAVAAVLHRAVAGPAYDSLATPLAFGLALLTVAAALGHVSGGHVNPAVTIGLAAAGAFPWRFVPAYVVAQIAGAVLGALATWVTFGGRARAEANLAATVPSSGTAVGTVVLIEALVTFILVFVVVSVATDDRVPAGLAPVAVGAALAIGVLVAGPVTGGSVNPARTLGPALVSWQFTGLWAYLVGPVVGGVLAALLYHRFLAQADAPTTDTPADSTTTDTPSARTKFS